MFGNSVHGTGVFGESGHGTAVLGQTAGNGKVAVQGQDASAGEASGVQGISVNGTGVSALSSTGAANVGSTGGGCVLIAGYELPPLLRHSYFL